MIDEQFCMVYSSSADLLHLVQTPDRLKWKKTDELHEDFLQALSEGDREHFGVLCRQTPDEAHAYGSMGVFRLQNFHGYSYAFAEKNAENGRDRVLVAFFKNTKRLNECLSPTYLRFFPALVSEADENSPLISPMLGFLRGKVQTVPELIEEHTNVPELTERILQAVREDPMFFGNSFSLISDFSFSDCGRDAELDYVLRFSSSAFVQVLYALFSALIEATVTHEIAVRVVQSDFGVKVGIETQIGSYRMNEIKGVTDLNFVSAFAEYSEALMALSEYISESNSFRPSVSYSSAQGVLSVSLSIAAHIRSEGEFRYRKPYEDLSELLKEASRLVRRLSGKSRSV